jgi:signal transduction histidine kinase
MTKRLPLLVVDDSDAERDLMTLVLGAAFPDSEIRSANHARVAREMCAAQAFECVLTDYNMPDLDGVALGLELRASHPHLPIILTTSVGDEMLAVEALRSGVSDYIPKSRVTVESIRRIIDRSIHTCAQSRVIDEQRSEIETFAYALAHDFKQPIRQITTFSELISDELRDHTIGDVEMHLKFMRDAAGRLGRLVDVMSQYTLLNQPPELVDIDLARVLASVGASLAPLLADRGASIVTTLETPAVHGNETLMTQVLQNLVINALQYNKSAVPQVQVTARAEAGHIAIEVRDNGIGIEPEYLAEIFKPLVRLHNSSEFPGSGLGLTIARRALISQKGDIWCESVIGQGSVFHLRLPAAHAQWAGDDVIVPVIARRR